MAYGGDAHGAVAGIVDAGLASRLRSLLAQVGKRRDADDNFPRLATGGTTADWRSWRIADKPPTIYHLDPASPVRFDVEAAFVGYRATLPPHVAALLAR